MQPLDQLSVDVAAIVEDSSMTPSLKSKVSSLIVDAEPLSWQAYNELSFLYIVICDRININE